MTHPLDEHRAAKDAQVAANHAAAEAGLPLPNPNIWDTWDPTKLPPGAPPGAIHQRYLEFCRLCPRPSPKRYTL